MAIKQVFPADHAYTQNELRKALGLSWTRYAGLRLLCWLRGFARFCAG